MRRRLHPPGRVSQPAGDQPDDRAHPGSENAQEDRAPPEPKKLFFTHESARSRPGGPTGQQTDAETRQRIAMSAVCDLKSRDGTQPESSRWCPSERA